MYAFFFVSFERWEPFLASNSIHLKSNDGAVVGHFICVGLFRYSVIPLFRVLKTPTQDALSGTSLQSFWEFGTVFYTLVMY